MNAWHFRESAGVRTKLIVVNVTVLPSEGEITKSADGDAGEITPPTNFDAVDESFAPVKVKSGSGAMVTLCCSTE